MNPPNRRVPTTLIVERSPNKYVTNLPGPLMNHPNLPTLFHLQSQRLGPRVALRYKKHGLYHDVSWIAYHEMVQACASALVDAGVRPGDRVGLLAENCLEWLVADLAIMSAGAINVPPHAPLTAKQVQFQYQETGVRWVFVSTPAQLEKVRQIRDELIDLEGVVVFEWLPLTPDPSPLSTGERGAKAYSPLVSGERGVMSWDGFLQKGRLSLERNRAELAGRVANLKLDDLATIMYTSGTTGNPKGVMLTHGNLSTNAEAMNDVAPRAEGAVVLSWLPFSHIYARTVDHYLSIVAAVPLCLAESADTLVQNLAEIQPTHLSSVPRFYEKVLAAVSGSNEEESRLQLRGVFGPRLDWLSSGGAPLAPAIAKAYREAGLLLLQGYGLTESSPVISFNHKEAYKLESVGRPIPGVEVKIADDGEVLTRGPHVMKGYWKNPQATAEAIRAGWLHTGDLGTLAADGFLSITGRKKELLVLSSGKKIAPNQVEGLIIGDPCVDQAVVHGEGKNFLTALIVPNWTNLRAALSADGFKEADLDTATLAKHLGVHHFMEERIAKVLAEVSPWERVKKFIIVPEPFSVAADELTVSLKLRRKVVFAHHQEELEELYRV
jgi:long-chain acyl-CoA synthetase